MNIRNYLLVFLVAICLDLNGQKIELIHHVSSDHLFSIKTEDNRDLSIYLNFSEGPGSWDYKSSPYFFVSGWYEFGNYERRNIFGIYRPFISLTAYVFNDTNYIRKIKKQNRLKIDTTKISERFFFPSINNSTNHNEASWIKEGEKLVIENIDFDIKNINHNIYLKADNFYRSPNSSIEITDFVIAPFGDNNILNLEDFNINLYRQHQDDNGDWHILLSITNEYVVPSSASSGGIYYVSFDKYQVIRETDYIETYNQGSYISYIDDQFQHQTKERHLILDDWNTGKIIGSFIIENAKLNVEMQW